MEELLKEAAKLALQIWFTNMRLAGLTASQMAEVYAETEKQFEANHPSNLPDPE